MGWGAPSRGVRPDPPDGALLLTGSAAPDPGARPPAQLSPWWILAAFAALAAGAGLGRVPAPVTAGAAVGLFGIAVARHPGNGLAALVLASPFLLGEPKTPYFLLEPVAGLGVLLSFLIHRLRGRISFVPAYGGAALVLVAAAVLALPLNLRDLVEDLWLFGSLDWSLILREGVPDISHLKYLERILVLALGVALFAVASQPAMLGALLGALRPLAVLVAALAAFGLLRFFGLVRTGGQYLTLSFWTWQNPDLRLTAVAWNPDYLAQWLVLVLPLVVALALVEGPRWSRDLAALGAALGATALLFTFQRAAYLAVLVALGVLALLVWRIRPARAGWATALVALAGLVVLAGAGLDAFVLHGRVAARLGQLADDRNRLRLWDAALRMALDHPLLGVGTGRYPFFFQEYTGPELRRGFPFWGTAHSMYLHLLAEQGLLGLASFLGFFGAVWAGALRRVGRLPRDRAVLVSGLVAALSGWLVYGLVQFTFRVNALVYLVCILTGALAALTPASRRPGLSRRWVLVAAALGLVILGVRAEAALRRPVSPGYEAGFHRWERPADGRPARWTRRRAALTTPVGGRVLELWLHAPIAGIEARPQVVRVWVNRESPRVVRLTGPRWEAVAVPVQAAPGAHVLVELEVAYTVVPSRRGTPGDNRTLGVMVGELAWRDG